MMKTSRTINGEDNNRQITPDGLLNSEPGTGRGSGNESHNPSGSPHDGAITDEKGRNEFLTGGTISGGAFHNPAPKTDEFIQPRNTGIRYKGKIARQINDRALTRRSAMTNKRAKHNKISTHGAARTNPMATGKQQINNTRYA